MSSIIDLLSLSRFRKKSKSFLFFGLQWFITCSIVLHSLCTVCISIIGSKVYTAYFFITWFCTVCIFITGSMVLYGLYFHNRQYGTNVKWHSDPWPTVTSLPIRLSTNFMTFIPSLTFTELWVVSMEHLQRVWLASRERLPFRTPGSVPHFGTCWCSNCWDQIPRACHVFTRLFTSNTPWYFLDFALYGLYFHYRQYGFVWFIFSLLTV